MSAHTPGPLGFVHSATTTANGGFHAYLVDSNDRKIAALWGGVDEKIANANLFSAAPDMLEALQRVIPANLCTTNSNVRDDTIVPMEVTMGELRAIRAAILKATGGAS